MTKFRSLIPVALPVIAVLVLAGVWGTTLHPVTVGVVAVVLAIAVLSAVHHAEVVAHRVGEPFGSLVLAVAVTIIEVALIITLMGSGKEGASTLARDTVFAAFMITLTGIIGASLLVAGTRFRYVHFNPEGSGAALATVTAMATLTLIVPAVTTSAAESEFTSSQLAFAGISSLLLYLAFVGTQTIRHRDFFLPVEIPGEDHSDDDTHADPPSKRATLVSLLLLLIALIAVVGLAKVESPSIEAGVRAAGFPASFVGVVIALLVLLPESIAAIRAASRNRMQISLNLAIGSAIASIGLTIPAIALASLWVDTPLVLGLSPLQIVLAALTVVMTVLTIVPGRATRMQAVVHLAVFAAFIFLSIVP